MTLPSAMTYDSLITDIASYIERTDQSTLNQIPRFIMLAENRIASEVRGLGMMKVVTGTMVLNNPTIAKPERWRENISFRVIVGTSKKTIFQRSYEYVTYYSPDPTILDVPRFYADYGYEHFYIAPTPLLNYTFELMYYERPQPLSSINETSWTTQYAPQLILYAALLEAIPYLKTDDRIPVYQGFYAQAVASIAAESKRRMFDKSASDGATQ
jgi:hypothetical protein